MYQNVQYKDLKISSSNNSVKSLIKFSLSVNKETPRENGNCTINLTITFALFLQNIFAVYKFHQVIMVFKRFHIKPKQANEINECVYIR